MKNSRRAILFDITIDVSLLKTNQIPPPTNFIILLENRRVIVVW